MGTGKLTENVVDHVVLATNDLEQTSALVAEATGVTPSRGGPHVGRGTHNNLCDLGGGAYLEIIGPDPSQPEPAAARPFGLDALTSFGVVTWCVRCNDLAAVKHKAESLDLPYAGPEAMRRQAPAGLLSWELLFPEFDTEGGILPFFINWGDSAHPAATAAHGLRLALIEGRHPEPAAVAVQLTGLGVSLQVHSAAEHGLHVVLEGPAGSLTLPTATFANPE